MIRGLWHFDNRLPVAGFIHRGAPLIIGSIPDTWFTRYAGDIVNTFSGVKGSGASFRAPATGKGYPIEPGAASQSALFAPGVRDCPRIRYPCELGRDGQPAGLHQQFSVDRGR